jgi:hypothetical protein
MTKKPTSKGKHRLKSLQNPIDRLRKFIRSDCGHVENGRTAKLMSIDNGCLAWGGPSIWPVELWWLSSDLGRLGWAVCIAILADKKRLWLTLGLACGKMFTQRLGNRDPKSLSPCRPAVDSLYMG